MKNNVLIKRHLLQRVSIMKKLQEPRAPVQKVNVFFSSICSQIITLISSTSYLYVWKDILYLKPPRYSPSPTSSAQFLSFAILHSKSPRLLLSSPVGKFYRTLCPPFLRSGDCSWIRFYSLFFFNIQQYLLCILFQLS